MFFLTPKFETIDKMTAKENLKNGYKIIDIRDKNSFKSGHIKGALNIPLAELSSRLNELDKKKNYMVICYVGGSSKTASKILYKAGFNVQNISGGMKSWE